MLKILLYNSWLTLGIGNERSQNGSKVMEVWPQSQHFNILFNCPTKRSERKRENKVNALPRLTCIKLLIAYSLLDILLALHAFFLKGKSGDELVAFGKGTKLSVKSAYMDYQASAHLQFQSHELCSRVSPSIKFTNTHLHVYTWVQRGTVRVKCPA